MSVWPGAWHRALGKLDPRPDVHVDHDADDLEDLLKAEVLGERVVEALERRVLVGVGGAGERLGIAESRVFGFGLKLGLLPRRQGVDLRSGDARLARRLVVQVEAVGAVVELRNSQAQELGEVAVDPQVRCVPERICAHFGYADQRLVLARVEPAVLHLDIVSHIAFFRCS
jgi:hypothetical protein